MVANRFTADPSSCHDTQADADGNGLLQVWARRPDRAFGVRNGSCWGIDCLIAGNISFRKKLLWIAEKHGRGVGAPKGTVRSRVAGTGPGFSPGPDP